MNLKNNRGAITVFISIVLSAILLVVGVFTDAARINLAHSHILRANKTAISSILACYNNQLKDEYGLFGVFQDSDTILESYEYYLSKNLNIYDKKDFLYDFNIEQVNIIEQYNLENRTLFEKQIIEFMKYRAPYELADDLLTKINGMKSISSSSIVCKRMFETDKKASEVGELQSFLEAKTKQISEMGITSKIKDMKESLLIQNVKYQEYIEKINSFQRLLSFETDNKKKEELSESIRSLRNELNIIVNIKQDIKNSILEVLNYYKNLNVEAIEKANDISVKKQNLLNVIQEELDYLKNTEDGIKEIQSCYENDLLNIKKLINEDNCEEIIGSLNNNIIKCMSISTKANYDEASFLSELDSISESNIKYLFDKAKPAKSDDEDNRDGIEKAMQNALSAKGDGNVIKSNLLEQLPSRKAKTGEEPDIDKSDSMYLSMDSSISKYLDTLSTEESTVSNSSSNSIWINNFKDISKIASQVIEDIYINEYIMGIFKHGVPLLKCEEDSAAYNLRSEDKTKRDGYFDNFEVEYIINGNEKEETNSLLLKSEILAIRLVANAIHIYTDSLKMSRITTLAASLSAWNAGLSTPLIQTMILFSWAMAESIYDLEQLNKGEEIQLIKTNEQWVTDISGALNKKTDNHIKNNSLSLNYHDYLKIFLLLIDKDKKIARIQDLIQLNMGISNSGFLLENCKIMLKSNTNISIKNLFISIPSNLSKLRSTISRTYISEDICIGYY
ncbi:hypothetical protein EHE19_012255 [Ruminiclostridium herbifermentans]|uniref:Uncharacterized protein n=1 Tax=Ruminiclostridium herbifermentans TaxID=2488810 RepID=A0A4U7JG34_9FIRM|nr:DUF5702 domain-containing protein [Ruminiclostridium herbifermentans]QNU65688.1 hypothetical protein EHE19_012255 [Ruminiclostridium herbifermentans]